MLNTIKAILGITNTAKDDLLTILIKQCTDEAILYTHNEDVDDLESAIVQMVIYIYNRLGSEGLSIEEYNGAIFHYADDYPKSVIRMLKAKRKVIFL